MVFILLAGITALGIYIAQYNRSYVFKADNDFIYKNDKQVSLNQPVIIKDDQAYLGLEDAVDLFKVEDPEIYTINDREYVAINDISRDEGLILTKYGTCFAISLKPIKFDLAQYDARFDNEHVYEMSKDLRPEKVVDPYVEYTYEMMEEDIRLLEENYPGLVRVTTFGKSTEGKDLYLIEFGYGERTVFINASIHGCEFFSTSFIMYLIDNYAYGYAMDEEYEGQSYREVLDNVTFIISPMLNPDGVNIAQNGMAASLNYENLIPMPGYEAGPYGWKTNSNGVDLNRNFPLNWSNANHVYVPGARYYHGPAAASEVETRAMIKALEEHPFYFFVDLHLYGENIDWIDTGTMDKYDEYYPFAKRLMDAFNYWGRDPEDISWFGGYLVNYVRNTYNCFSALIEMTDTWRCPPVYFDNQTKNLYQLLFILADEIKDEEPLQDNAYRFTLNGNEIIFDAPRQRGAVSEKQFERLMELLDLEIKNPVPDDSARIRLDYQSNIYDFEKIMKDNGVKAELSEDGSMIYLEYLY
jgi:hypothetical protein